MPEQNTVNMAKSTVLHDHEPLGAEKENISDEEVVHDGELKLSGEELALEKKLRFKVDIVVMPLVILVYLMNYIDRNNYASARLQGLEKDLNLKGDEYQVALSILFVGYVRSGHILQLPASNLPQVLMQVPSNLLLNYAGRPSWFLGIFTIAWGLISTCTSQVHNYGQMVACRFLLGLVGQQKHPPWSYCTDPFIEAPFFAGVLFYLSKWYTKSELSLRMAIFSAGSPISGAFGSLIAAGILSGLDNKEGLAPWQWLYIIEGSITVFLGIVMTVIMPDFPDTWKALSPEMKHVANKRLAIDGAEVDTDVGISQWTGFKMAMTDPKTYILAVAYHALAGGPWIPVLHAYSYENTRILIYCFAATGGTPIHLHRALEFRPLLRVGISNLHLCAVRSFHAKHLGISFCNCKTVLVSSLFLVRPLF